MVCRGVPASQIHTNLSQDQAPLFTIYWVLLQQHKQD